MASDDKTFVDLTNGVPAGTQLNGIYEIDERVAMGGMGEVYRGHNIQTGDLVAIKIVLPEFSRDETILALFRKEASVLNHLSHDAIVRYHVFTVDPGVGRPYLAMEFVDGLSLADRVKQGPMELKDAKKMVAAVASGLNAAHEAGIIHRDLSPDNIILVEGLKKKKAKIIDFGIAKSSGIGGGTLLGGKFAGKYNFVSPEQLGLFDGEVTERSDIYSLGLVFAAALLGETLDMGGSQVDVIEKRRVVPDISKIDPEVRPIIMAMLQPDPADRPESMAIIQEWLFPPEVSSSPSSATHPPVSNVDPLETIIAPAPVVPPVSPAVSAPAASIPPTGAGIPAPGHQTSANPFDPQTGVQIASQPPAADFVPHYSPQLPPAAETPAEAGTRKSRSGFFAGLFIVLLAAGGWAAFMNGMLDEFLARKPTGEEVVSTPDLSPPTTIETTELKPENIEEKPEIVENKPEEIKEKPIDVVATRLAWLDGFDGGACFYASTTQNSENSMRIEGFSTSVRPLEKLDKEFQLEHKMEPDIQVRLIDKNQCAVADFLQKIRSNDVAKPTLSLSSSNVKSGQSLSGELANVAGGIISLLLIDNEGVVYNLDKFLKKKEDKASFSIKLVDLETRDPLPQLILALSSREGLSTIQKSEPELASALLKRVLSAIEKGDLHAGAVVKYFKLGG